MIADGKYNVDTIKAGIVNGKRSAEAFMNSQTYKDAVAHDIALAKRAFNVDIKPVPDARYATTPVQIEMEPGLQRNTLGRMISDPMANNPADDLIQ